MEDINIGKRVVTIIKWIVIIGIICTISFLILNFAFQKSNENKLEKYLKNNGYKESYGIWSKKETKNNKNYVADYSYDINQNIFTKSTDENKNNYQQSITFTYNGENEIVVYYDRTDIIDDDSCNIVQKATYNYKNNDFNCTVSHNPDNCDLRCNEIKKYSKQFSKEINEILNNSNVNKWFLIKGN